MRAIFYIYFNIIIIIIIKFNLCRWNMDSVLNYQNFKNHYQLSFANSNYIFIFSFFNLYKQSFKTIKNSYLGIKYYQELANCLYYFLNSKNFKLNFNSLIHDFSSKGGNVNCVYGLTKNLVVIKLRRNSCFQGYFQNSCSCLQFFFISKKSFLRL